MQVVPDSERQQGRVKKWIGLILIIVSLSRKSKLSYIELMTNHVEQGAGSSNCCLANTPTAYLFIYLFIVVFFPLRTVQSC